MAETGMRRPLMSVCLVALGIVIGIALARVISQGPDESEVAANEPTETMEVETRASSGDRRGLATRRIAEGCDPVVEANQYEAFIGRRSLVVLSWNNLAQSAADLKIPMFIHGIENDAISVGVLDIPMREQYLVLWLGSGHLQRGPGDTFLLDPCSARVKAWEAMDQLHPPVGADAAAS